MNERQEGIHAVNETVGCSTAGAELFFLIALAKILQDVEVRLLSES